MLYFVFLFFLFQMNMALSSNTADIIDNYSRIDVDLTGISDSTIEELKLIKELNLKITLNDTSDGQNKSAALEKILILSNLQHLTLDDLPISKIPPLKHFPKLKSLSVLSCPIESITDEFDNCTQLESLILNGTNIQNLPETISNLVNLRKLDISYNSKLNTLPRSLHKLVNLHDLSLIELLFDEPTIDYLEQKLLDKKHFPFLNKYLIDQELEFLIEAFKENKRSHRARKCISDWSPEQCYVIDQRNFYYKLDLSNTAIENLTDIENLPITLVSFDASGNVAYEIKKLSEVSNLILILDLCPISNLIPLQKLENLKFLSLQCLNTSNTKESTDIIFATLPLDLSIEILDISCNDLTCIPASIASYTLLNKLFIQSNKLKNTSLLLTSPEKILSPIKRLDISFNPLITEEILIEVLSTNQTTDAVPSLQQFDVLSAAEELGICHIHASKKLFDQLSSNTNLKIIHFKYHITKIPRNYSLLDQLTHKYGQQ